MKRNSHIIALYVRRYFLQWLAWRSFAFTLVVNQAVTPLIGLAVWTTALPNQQHITVYYVLLLFVRMMTVSYENHTFSGRIYTGDVADDLLRPHPVILQPLGENIAIRIWHLLMALPLLLIVGSITSLHLDWMDIVIGFPALLMAATLQFLFTYSLALAAFWTERAHGVVAIGSTLIFLLGGVAFPLNLLPDTLRIWFELLPFRAMMAFPAEIFSGNLTVNQSLVGYGWQLLWLSVFAGVTLLLWRTGIRRYTVIGA